MTTVMVRVTATVTARDGGGGDGTIKGEQLSCHMPDIGE